MPWFLVTLCMKYYLITTASLTGYNGCNALITAVTRIIIYKLLGLDITETGIHITNSGTSVGQGYPDPAKNQHFVLGLAGICFFLQKGMVGRGEKFERKKV